MRVVSYSDPRANVDYSSQLSGEIELHLYRRQMARATNISAPPVSDFLMSSFDLEAELSEDLSPFKALSQILGLETMVAKVDARDARKAIKARKARKASK
jgi:hypothetical protein